MQYDWRSWFLVFVELLGKVYWGKSSHDVFVPTP